MSFITVLFNVVMNIILDIVNLILLPIDLLIQAALPGLSAALTAIGSFLSLIATYMGWALSAAGIPTAAVSLLMAFLIFKLTIPIQVWVIKLAVKWYTQLKP